MDWKLLAILLSLALAVGCGDDDGGGDTPEGGTPDATGGDTPDADTGPDTTYFFVADTVAVAEAMMGNAMIVGGFNLDDAVTASGDTTTGCGKMDFTSPPPDNEPGVDNQLGPILAGLPGDLNVAGALRDTVNEGDLLLLFEVSGVNGTNFDPNVTVDIFLGTLTEGTMMPMLAGDRLAPGQTFDINASVGDQANGTPLASVQGQIREGRLQAGPADIPIDITLGDITVTLAIRTAQIRVSFNAAVDSGTSGIIGGALRNMELVDNLAAIPDLEGNEALVMGILQSQADLEPGDDGRCGAVSIGLEFTLAQATKGTPRMPAMGM
ncbi:MAG: hypothetical protein AAGF12_28390 [Myxococcota bacterium]